MGGSGGGSSGAVSFPAYMQTVHGLWLDDAGTDTPDLSLVAAINTATGASPFSGLVAYDPDTDITTMLTAASNFSALVEALSFTGDFTTAYNTARGLIDEDDTQPTSSAEVDADIQTYSDLLDDIISTRTLPEFQVGMLNIGAVNTSAFVIGESLIRAFKGRDVAKYGTELRQRFALQSREIEANHKIHRGDLVRFAVAQMLASLLKQKDLMHQSANLTAEVNRIKIVAKKEEIGEQIDFDEKDALWDIELFSAAQNLLAGPGGGVHQNQRRPSRAVSAIGGAISGAAAGAAVTAGNPYGAAAGAVVGAGLALLQ